MNISEQYGALAGYNRESGDKVAVWTLKKAYQRINILRLIQATFPASKPLRVFEFGPGLGSLIDLMYENAEVAEYSVADVDRNGLNDLSVQFPNITTVLLDSEGAPPSRDGIFDIIVAVDVWEHLSFDAALNYTVWAYERLAPEGLLVLQVPNWGCPVTPLTFFGDLTHRLMFNEKSIRQLLRAASVPDYQVSVLPRRTPGWLGSIRDALGVMFGWVFRLAFVFFGSPRLKIFSADLIAVVHKKNG